MTKITKAASFASALIAYSLSACEYTTVQAVSLGVNQQFQSFELASSALSQISDRVAARSELKNAV